MPNILNRNTWAVEHRARFHWYSTDPCLLPFLMVKSQKSGWFSNLTTEIASHLVLPFCLFPLLPSWFVTVFYFLIFFSFTCWLLQSACALHGIAWLSFESCVACVQVTPQYLWAWVMEAQAPLWAPEPGPPRSRSNPTPRPLLSSSNNNNNSRAATGNRLWQPSCQ